MARRVGSGALPDYIFDAVASILTRLLPQLQRPAGQIADQDQYASYRRVLARLLADTRAAARSATVEADIAAVISGYRLACDDMRAVIAGLERLITATRAIVPTAADCQTMRQQRENEDALLLLFETLAIAEQGAALAQLTPRSHDEARNYRLRFGRSIELTIERASDARLIDVTRALRDVRGAIARDMIDRGRSLARVVSYETGVPLSSVVLAHLLYQDASRGGELEMENPGHDHPAFMPTTGRAYSR